MRGLGLANKPLQQHVVLEDPLHGHRQQVRQQVQQLELPRDRLVHGDQRVVDVLLLVGAADMFVVEVRGVLVVCLSPVLFVTTFSWWASYQPSKESRLSRSRLRRSFSKSNPSPDSS